MIPPKLLLMGYRQGLFPMALEGDELGWFSPDPRGILPLDGFRVPHGLARTLKKGGFEIRINSAFKEVILGCASRPQTWINDEIVASYCELHRLGYAHSVEAWVEGRLGGGLYGVAQGSAFFGESMFHTVRDASKVALFALVCRLRERGFTLLDLQWVTDHLRTFGAIEIPRLGYLSLLAESLENERCSFTT